MNSFYCILLLGGGTGSSSYFPFRTKSWTEPYDYLYWNMLSHRLNYGMFLIFNAQMYHELMNANLPSTNSMLVLIFAYIYIGYECQSASDSFEAYV
jgi:hypothetical protein